MTPEEVQAEKQAQDAHDANIAGLQAVRDEHLAGIAQVEVANAALRARTAALLSKKEKNAARDAARLAFTAVLEKRAEEEDRDRQDGPSGPGGQGGAGAAGAAMA